jgi:bacillolysin
MKKLLFTFVCISSMLISRGMGQLDTMFSLGNSVFDSAGFSYYFPSTVSQGQLFPMYELFSNDLVNNFTLNNSFEDSILHLTHDFYQQTYKGVPVEGAHYIEHSQSGYLVYMNGKLCSDLNASITPGVSESQALANILGAYPDSTIYAWNNTDWETQIKTDMNDASATFYPEGELLFALDNFDSVPVFIPGSRYVLAWRFEILSLYPHFHKAIFVNATSGVILREEEVGLQNGYAYLYYGQTQFIDTEWTGNITRHILHANDNGRNIQTKKRYGLLGSWGLGNNYNDGDDSWDQSENDTEGTSAHWFATQSWDFWQAAPFLRNGYDGNGTELRVLAEIPPGFGSKTQFTYNINDRIGYLELVPPSNRAIDVVGHEFSHGVLMDLNMNAGEARSLNESFADIFGELIESNSKGVAIDWIVGNDFVLNNEPLSYVTRSLAAPKTAYVHFTNAQCSTAIGQPNTYRGTFWEFGTDCEDSHINAGVHNYWFYLLTEGGTGSIDDDLNLTTYSVQGIGSLKASIITYLNFTTNFASSADFGTARQGAITLANLLHGVCSNEAIQVQNAWYAVGIGSESNCAVAIESPESVQIIAPIVYPNPASDRFNIDFPEAKARQITVFDIFGTIVVPEFSQTAKKFELELKDLPAGMYFATVHEKFQMQTIKLIKK